MDLKNGDKGPRAISVVMGNDGELKKNQILVCNFEDSKGNAGAGHDHRAVLADSELQADDVRYRDRKIAGCDGTAITSGGSNLCRGHDEQTPWSEINPIRSDQEERTSKPITMPIADSETPELYFCYSPHLRLRWQRRYGSRR